MRERYIYISTMNSDECNYKILLQDVYKFLFVLNFEYPGFNNWYWNKVVPFLNNNEKEIIAAIYNGRIIGVSIIKKTLREKKICTLRVHKHYGNSGIGNKLMYLSLIELNTESPVISVSSHRILQFKKMFQHYGFELGESYCDYYKKGNIEYCYNGCLPGDSYNPNYKKIVNGTTCWI